jgi:hypothetical protein
MILGSTASANDRRVEGRPEVTVCMERVPDPLLSIARAQVIARGIFDRIGVDIAWHNMPRCPREKQPIVITISLMTPRDEFPHALAYSQPFEGVHIRVFYDRLVADGICPPQIMLGHVLAHEIGHVLQGTDQHATDGVMKARWNERDYAHMGREPMGFSDLDILLIQNGIAARVERLRGLSGQMYVNLMSSQKVLSPSGPVVN